MKKRSRRWIVSLALGLAAVGIWFEISEPSSGPVLPPYSDSRHQPREQLAQAAKTVVHKNNRKQSEQKQRFIDDGWTIVDTAAPDERILSLDPSMLDRPQTEVLLQVQMQSNTHSGPALDRIKTIALTAKNEKTRQIAIESLGRSPDPRAQNILMESYSRVSIGDQTMVIGFLRPQSESDAVAKFLFRRLGEQGGHDSNTEMKRQAASNLLGMSFFKNIPLEQMLKRVPHNWRDEFKEQYQAAASSGPHKYFK